MDSVISWIVLDVVVLIVVIRFAVYVLNQHEAYQEEEKRNNDK